MTGLESVSTWFAPWLRGPMLYVGVAVPAHLLWEILQLPLYTIWTAPVATRAFAIAHCTIGDAMIAASTLIFAWIVTGRAHWPQARFWSVALVTVVLGLGYTIFSEWLNVTVQMSWAYSATMPVIPMFGFEVGLSPVLQWIVVPAIGFAIVRWWSHQNNFSA